MDEQQTVEMTIPLETPIRTQLADGVVEVLSVAEEQTPTKEQEQALVPKVTEELDYKDIELGTVTSERVLEQYVYENINKLWKDIFNEEVVECIKQYAEPAGIINVGKSLLPSRGARIDLFVKCATGNNYLVEIKNPRYGQNETLNAIGKLLFYSVIFSEANKLVVLSTIYERAFNDTVTKYNLPIDFVLFGRDGVYLLKR